MIVEGGTRIEFEWGQADIERAYDEAAGHDLPLITLIGAGLFMLFAIVDTLTHPGEDQLFRFLSAFLPAVAFACIAAVARRGRIRPRSASWWTAGAALLALAGPLITVERSRHEIDFAFCMLIVVAAGACVYRYLPLVITASFTGAIYVALAFQVASNDSATDWIAAYVMSFGLGTVLLAARRRSVREFAEARAELRHAAGHDALTGLVNRHGLQTAGPTLMALARRDGRNVFAAFVDIDRLSEINNQYGHGAGDEVITTVAHALANSVREADVVSRWGGDEIVLVGIGDGPDPHRIEEAVRDFALRTTAVPGWDGQVSVGVTTVASTSTSFETLILTADAAMYDRRGRRRSGAA